MAFWSTFLLQLESLPNFKVSQLFWGNYFGLDTPKVRKTNAKVCSELQTDTTKFRKEISRLWKQIPSTHSEKYAVLMITSQVRAELKALRTDTKHAAAFIARMGQNGDVQCKIDETVVDSYNRS